MGNTLTAAIGVANRRSRIAALRAVDYLRVSTEEQAKGYGIQAAAKKTVRHIEKKGWEHVGTYADEGLSGSLEEHERPDLKRLMQQARQTPRPFDMVVVSEGRAIGRTGRAFWRWVWELEEMGVYVAVVKGDYDNSTAEGRKKMRKDADYAEEEREIIRERTQGGIQEKAEEGGHFGGTAPYGWRIEDKGRVKLSRLVIDESAAATLRKAWSLIVEEGLNAREAASRLNTLAGHPAPRGGLWSGNSLRHILKGSPIQEGVRVYRSPKSSTGKRGTKLDADGRPVYGETVTVELDRIFSQEEVLRLNAGLARTARKRFSKSGVHPLSKRIFNSCGKHYTGVSRTATTGRAYRCSGKIELYPGQPKCSCSQVNADAIEERVWTKVCELLEDPERLQAMAGDWVGMAEQSDVNHEERARELEKQIAGQDAAITAAVLAAAKEPDAAAAIGAAIKTLKDERAKLVALLDEAKAWRQDALAASQRARDLKALATVAKERLHDMDPRQQAEVLALLDVRVTLLGDVPVRVREDDRLDAWFRSRGRLVPVMTDEAWKLVEHVFAGRSGRPSKAHRRLLEAVLHKARTGCTWRDLPEEYGPFGTIASAFNRWRKSGLWDQAMEALAGCPGEALPSPVHLPPLQVEGRLDPRLLVCTQATPEDDAPCERLSQGVIRFQMRLAA